MTTSTGCGSFPGRSSRHLLESRRMTASLVAQLRWPAFSSGSATRSERMAKAIQTTPLTHFIDSAVLLVTISRPPQGRALTATLVRLLE